MRYILIAVLFLPIHLCAQYNFEKTFDPIVINGNDTLQLAWVGGFNNPQFSNIDIDQDGDNDLFVFDRSGDVNLLFKIEGSGSSLTLTPKVDELENFPYLKAWALLKDYNLDGKTDIFTHSDSIAGGGIAVFKNIGTTGSPDYELIDGLFDSYSEFESASFTSPLYVNAADIPSFIDVDEDGDTDILTFSINGSELEYHENQSQEIYDDNEHFEFELKNACWGYFKESAFDNTVSLYDSCVTNVVNPKALSTTNKLHVGSTVLGLDLNGDDVKDLIIGDITGSNLISLVNGGTTTSGIMTSFNSNFPENSIAVDIQVFPSPYYVDIDNDGINDLVVAPNAPNTANNFEATWLYSNSNTNSSPDFDWEENSFMQGEMIDRGSNAMPVLFDYNADGKLDLVVANKSFYDDDSQQISKLALYENTGTSASLSFVLIDDDYLNLDELGMTLALYPTFGDLDNDGDEDLIIGDLNGLLHYFENTAGTGNTADFSLTIPGITDNNDEVIDVGQFAYPFMIDIDRDEKMDLIIGERSGVLNYYQNTGTSEEFIFTLVDETFGGIEMPGDFNEGFSVPFILDSEEGYQLFVGSNQGEVLHFYPIEDDLTADFDVVDSNILPFREGKRTGITIADIDNHTDGLEMIAGNYRGGLGFYYQSGPISIIEHDKIENPFKLYPNPAQDYIRLSTDNEFEYTYSLVNALGQIIITEKLALGNQLISLSNLPAGSYFIRIKVEDIIFINPFYIIH